MKRLAFILVLAGLAWGALAQSRPSSAPVTFDAELQEEQAKLLARKKREVEALPESPQKERARAILAEVERRLREEAPDLYVAPGRMSDDMKSYYQRVQRRIEDCGTRHFPMDDGKSVYGKAVVEMKLDQAGTLLHVDIPKPSGNPVLDSHIKRLVRASSPFGPIPKTVVQANGKSYKNVVIFTSFEFHKDDSRPTEVVESERCKWK